MRFLMCFVLTIFLVIKCEKALLAMDWNLTQLRLDGITSIEKTHNAIYAGEFDTRSWLNPYRGIYKSTDLGETWQQAGLQDRGVTSLSYEKTSKRLYASTYYSVFDPNSGTNKGGLFYLDTGTWYHTGPSVSTASVLALPEVILLGTNAHGLWVSHDGAQTWTQKIGSGYFGPKFRVIRQSGEKILAHDEFNVYESSDWGNTFSTIAALKDEKIADIVGNGQNIVAGTSNFRGAFVSYNNGNTWSKIQQFEGKIVGKLAYFPLNSTFYAYVKDNTTSFIYASNDLKTWQNISFPNLTVSSIQWVFSEPSNLFAAAANSGVYKAQIVIAPIQIQSLFSNPWETTVESELTDKISSFFDHAYPFLGYWLYSEPEKDAATTTNYLGLTDKEPFLYYSSHDGIDFALPFGTEVQAVSDGIAKYYYQKNGLGHYIELTHVNEPYQTLYGHLQELPSKDYSTAKAVHQGDVLGKIGMSGRTTGPHLHFTVIKDLEMDSNFENDIAQGKTDPFGWQNPKISDPWENYTWSDSAGDHTSSNNIYLWKNPLQTYAAYSSTDSTKITNNFDIRFLNHAQQSLTAVIKRIPSKSITPIQKTIPFSNLVYNIELFDHFGEIVTQTQNPLELVFSYANENINNIKDETINIYHLTKDNSWELVPSVNDTTNKTLTALATNFSTYAVFGQKNDFLPPQTQIQLIGTIFNEQYINQVQVTLQAQDIDYQSNVKHTFYKVNDQEWQEYTSPFFINDSGNYTISYKSIDEHENMELEQVSTFSIDTPKGNKVTIKSAIFSTN